MVEHDERAPLFPKGAESCVTYGPPTASQTDLLGLDHRKRIDIGAQSHALSAAPAHQEARRALTQKNMVNTSRGFVDTYNLAALLTPRVMVTIAGTVFENQILWMSEGLVICIYLLTAVLVIMFPFSHVDTWVHGMEDRSQHFVFSFQFLVAFLLSFYVSLSVTRWWSLRVDGIGKIEKSTHDLLLFISRFVTEDQEILSSISRYAQASLVLLFSGRAAHWEDHLITELHLVDAEEWDDLQAMENGPRAMWEWITDILAALYTKKLIKSEPQLTFFMQMCSVGCEGVDHIQRQLSTMIPLPYVHLICLLVKIHNILLAILMGAFTGCYFIMGQKAMCVQILAQVFVTSTAYNACLAISEVLSDPFTGECNDFNLPRILRGIQTAASDAGSRTEHYNKWLTSPRLEKAGRSASHVTASPDV